MTAGTSFRKPLLREEVPIPPGYSSDILRDEIKQQQRDAHLRKVREVREERVRVDTQARENPEYRAVVLEKCRRSCVYFIQMFGWGYDDRKSMEEPFALYDFQENKIVRPYEQFVKIQPPSRATYAYLKSRGMGFTWAEMLCRTWAFLFIDNWSILIGAENRDDIDDGGQEATHQTLFGKIRFIIGHLPVWMRKEMLGPLFEKEEHNKRWHMQNPMKPRNMIHGKQFGAMFGRSRRYSEILGDEVAHAEEIKNADTALKQTTNRAMFGSTPKGKGNFFYQLFHGELRVVRFTMWWGEHPMLDVAWYNEQRQEMTDSDIAQELDLSFEGSAGGRVLYEISTDEYFIELKDRPFLFEERLDQEIILDPGIADNFAAVWTQWDEVQQQGRVVDFVQTNRRAVDWIVPFILGRIPEFTYRNDPWKYRYNEVEMQIIARHGKWGPPRFVFGDAAGWAQNVASGSSAWEELDHYGIKVDEIRIKDDEEAIRRLQLFVRHVRFAKELLSQRNGPENVSPSMGDVVTQWRFPEQRDNTTQQVRRPIHDVYCHGGDCLKMWAQVHELPDTSVEPVEKGQLIQRRGSDIVYPDYQSPFRS